MKLKKITAPINDTGLEEVAEPRFPQLYMDSEQIPEVNSWQVGETYRLIVDVIMKSKGQNKDGSNGSFDVVAYKEIEPAKSINDMTDSEFGEYQSDQLSKK